MEHPYYLAIDIGASSGRHILGWIENGKIRIEEIHRFQNGLVGRNGHLCWDVDHLFHEVVEGLKRCRTLNRIPKSVGIDTWAVDFVLLDGDGRLLGDTVAYRDGRTQLVSAETQDWDYELMDMLGIPKEMFGAIAMPKTPVGALTEKIAAEVGFQTEVVLPATHDTGSAVMAVPSTSDDSIYLSSGTWSLMGIERLIPDCSEVSQRHNFTNEGGYHYRYRYLKNIMGMWIMQNLRKEFRHDYTFEELYQLAHIGRYFASTVDVNDAAFLAPQSMRAALQEYCGRTGQEAPETECELLYCVYNSLAQCYAETVAEIEEVTGRTFDRIHVVGGGCQDQFLNRLLQQQTGKEVCAGPVEATAIGNLMAQMLKDKVFEDLSEARQMVAKSFDVNEVSPVL